MNIVRDDVECTTTILDITARRAKWDRFKSIHTTNSSENWTRYILILQSELLCNDTFELASIKLQRMFLTMKLPRNCGKEREGDYNTWLRPGRETDARGGQRSYKLCCKIFMTSLDASKRGQRHLRSKRRNSSCIAAASKLATYLHHLLILHAFERSPHRSDQAQPKTYAS